MPEPPNKFDKERRRPKLSSKSDVPSKTSRTEKPATGAASLEKPTRSAEPSGPGIGASLARNSNAIWALIAGLAIGFAVGREAYRFGGTASNTPVEGVGPLAEIAPDNAPGIKVYASMADFPAGWVKASDLGERASLLAGLTEAQKVTVMQAMNERTCNCGCAFGKLAQCLQKDPNCPNSPSMAKLAVDLAKQGKSLTDILAAIDAKDSAPKKAAPAEPEAPAKPQYVELAAWNPRKGPSSAKVTVVEFSDFQ